MPDVLVNLLVTDRWAGRVNHEELLFDADWEQIESAIRRLDGHTYTSVSIEKVPADSDDNEGDIYLSVAGGPERFLVVFHDPDQPEFVAANADDATEEIELVIGGQSAAFPSRVCVNLATAVVAGREFSYHGAPAAALTWIERKRANI